MRVTFASPKDSTQCFRPWSCPTPNPRKAKAMSGTSVNIRDLVKTYLDNRGKQALTAVKSINLHIDAGEFMVLVGPSGCGKSTTLRMIAGLERVTSGTISIDGRVVNHLEPKDRGVAMVFQSYALYPHFTVFNMTYALTLAKKAKEIISEIVARIRGEHLFRFNERVTIQINMEKLTLFDPDTEEAIRQETEKSHASTQRFKTKSDLNRRTRGPQR